MVQETYFDDQKVESPNAEYDAADIASATLGEILGMGTGSPISGFGGGLEMDGNGNLQVNSAYFDGSITGISNPLTANLDAANYDVTNVGALEADKTTTANLPTSDDDVARRQEIEQSGTVSLVDGSGLAAASDDSWDTVTSVAGTATEITFNEAFASAPDISLALRADQSDFSFGWDATVESVDSTTLRLRFFNYSTRDFDSKNDTLTIGYIATGGRP